MTRKIMKWIGIVLVGVVGIVSATLAIITNRKANVVYAIETAALSIPTDEASIAAGERVVAIRGCADCHGDDFSGDIVVDDAALGTFYAPNLTGSSDSVTVDYTPDDWDRAIRHGVGRDSKALWLMPSTDYYRISDRNLELMIAYLESLPAVDQPELAVKPGPLGIALTALGQIEFAANLIDHDTPAPANVTAEVSVEYGSYLATTCTGCHGQDFSGGPIVGLPPEFPPAANLTPAGDLGNWDQAAFINTLRTGVTPEGKTLNPEYMPWPITLQMTEDELSAIWLYLSSVPAIVDGG
jgi:cytochrome c553